MSRQRMLEMERAEAARECVKRSVVEKREKDRNFARGYAQTVRSAGADILTNGLGQTLAFWRAKGKKDKYFLQLLDDLSEWMKGKLEMEAVSLLDWVVTKATPTAYRRALKESMAFLAWVKRFAEAEMPEEAGDGG